MKEIIIQYRFNRDTKDVILLDEFDYNNFNFIKIKPFFGIVYVAFRFNENGSISYCFTGLFITAKRFKERGYKIKSFNLKKRYYETCSSHQ